MSKHRIGGHPVRHTKHVSHVTKMAKGGCTDTGLHAHEFAKKHGGEVHTTNAHVPGKGYIGTGIL